MPDNLNIVLVHGAFGDGSHWRHIIPGLYRAGHRAMAAQNPLTSLADDVASTGSWPSGWAVRPCWSATPTAEP
jgi:hypothetical protein